LFDVLVIYLRGELDAANLDRVLLRALRAVPLFYEVDRQVQEGQVHVLEVQVLNHLVVLRDLLEDVHLLRHCKSKRMGTFWKDLNSVVSCTSIT